MEDAALIFWVHAAEEKVDNLEGRIEEMEKSLGRLQAKLHCRCRTHRHSPIITIGSGSLEDPLEIVSEADCQLTLRQRARRTRQAVEVLDKAIQVPDIKEEEGEGEGSNSSGLSYHTVPAATPASPSPVVSHNSDPENTIPVPIPPPHWENKVQRQQVLDKVDRHHAIDPAEFEYETLISRGMSFCRDQLTDRLIPHEE